MRMPIGDRKKTKYTGKVADIDIEMGRGGTIGCRENKLNRKT